MPEVWALHAFQVFTSGLMLGWYLRFHGRRPQLHEPAHAHLEQMGGSPDAVGGPVED